MFLLHAAGNMLADLFRLMLGDQIEDVPHHFTARVITTIWVMDTTFIIFLASLRS